MTLSPQQQQPPLRTLDYFSFPLIAWLLSRALVLLCFFVIAPMLDITSPRAGYIPEWNLTIFSLWDGEHYKNIVTSGYEYAEEANKSYNVAFFPLLPLLTWLVTKLGLSFELAAGLINHAAFLATLCVLFKWMHEKFDSVTAKWIVVVLAFFPYSLFASIAYTESLFLLTTTMALYALERGKYIGASAWGALATFSRPPGILLAPVIFFTLWFNNKRLLAFIVSGLSLTGIVLYALYLWIQFDDPLAFYHAQAGWKQHAISWLMVVETILNEGVHAYDSILKLGFLVGGIFLYGLFYRELKGVILLYGLFSTLLFLLVNIQSFLRFSFSNIAFIIAIGLFCARFPKLVVVIIIGFILMLCGLSVRFPWYFWVA